ncbi:MAG: TonB-dependent receptor [Chitinophagaceae bacterium]|nr:TonB-dependent receptor [Chitinophagaceae bacterium]
MKRHFFVLAAVIFSNQLKAQEDTTLLNEVVITTNKYPKKQSETGKVVTTISREQLERSGGKTLPEILNSVTGTVIIGANNALGTNQTVSIRGASAGNVLILLDGIPVNDPSVITNYFDLNFLTTDQVERIELLKGGQSTLYGSDAVAGVINIISKKAGAKKLHVHGAFSCGSFNNLRQNIGINGRGNKADYSLNYTHLSNDGFSAAFDSSGSAGFDRDGFNQHAITGRTGFAAGKTIRISLSGSYSNYQTDIDASAYTDDRDFTSESNNIQFGGGLLHHFSNGSIHLNYNYNRIERSYLDDSSHKSNLFAFYSKSNYIGRTHYAELYGNWRMSQWEILAGTDFRSANTDQWYWSTGIFGPFNQPVLNARAKQISPYASVIYKGKGLNVELGGRFNEHSAYGSNFTFTFNPSFLVKNKAKVFANLYSAFKAPTLYQLFDAYAGNASLLPEKGIIGEAGAELLSGKPISARIVGFYRKTTDAIVYTFNPSSFQSKYLNVSKQINNGIEAELSYAKNIYSISANYTYTNGKTTSLYDGTGSPLGKDTSYYNLYRIPKHAFNLTAGIRFSKDFFVSTHFRSISKREEFIYGSSPETIDGYAIVDLYGEYKFGKAIRVFVDLKNITNKVYFDIPGYNARKFNFITGLSFQL